MSLARRNLFQEPLRFALSALGVALAIMLILLLGGLQTGVNRQISAYLDHASGSVVVAQKGVPDLLGASSLLPPGTVERAKHTPGVARAIPILSQFVILTFHGTKQPAYLVGYDPALGGGPWTLARGRAPRTDREIVFDQVLTQRHHLDLGSSVEVMGRRFSVVGLSSGTSSWMTSFFFMKKTAAESLLRLPRATSFLLITPSSGTSEKSLLHRLAVIPGTQSVAKTTMMANDRALYARTLNPILDLMVGIAFLIGTLVIGLVVYTATVERRREYGVLKAIGARNRLLYRVVAGQALIATSVGSLLGLGLAVVTGQLVMMLRPQFLVALEPEALGRAVVVGLAMGFLAALVPARVIARLAPADVFRR